MAAQTKSMFETFDLSKVPDGIKVKQLKEEPRIFSIDDFLTDEECSHLIHAYRGILEHSQQVSIETGEASVDDYRNSSSTWIENRNDEIVAEIEERIAQVIQHPAEKTAKINLLRYNPGQKYGPHHDYFDPANPKMKKTLEEQGQRFMTILLYLAEGFEGGETRFPEVDYEYVPKKRSALIFYNVLPDGNIDPLSLHESKPILNGRKWVATKWIMELEPQ